MNYLIFNKIDSGKKKRIRTRRYGRDGYGKKRRPLAHGDEPGVAGTS